MTAGRVDETLRLVFYGQKDHGCENQKAKGELSKESTRVLFSLRKPASVFLIDHNPNHIIIIIIIDSIPAIVHGISNAYVA